MSNIASKTNEGLWNTITWISRHYMQNQHSLQNFQKNYVAMFWNLKIQLEISELTCDW